VAPDDDDAAPDDDDAAAPPDLGATGPFTVVISTGSTTAGTSCELPWTLYEPSGATGAEPVVVLAHGFLRGQAQMAGLGEHLASWGLRAATPALCHSSLLDSDPPLNGADMVALAGELAAGADRSYVGHSAGGAAAVIAAAADATALAVVGLDAVDDSEGVLTGLAPTLSVPVHAIFGEISGCNQSGSAVAPLGTAPDSTLLQVVEADHCDFEDPYDPLCSILCSGSNALFTDDAIRHTIRSLLTAALLWRSGLEPAGEGWWTAGGGPHDDLLAAGAIGAL
jgi:dienelactone hydrolase